ncbi:MAG: hypothetical protein OSA51_13625 [Octadecabacter sp.]|nr:hypothetical protein [Octadecabacter sp.]
MSVFVMIGSRTGLSLGCQQTGLQELVTAHSQRRSALKWRSTVSPMSNKWRVWAGRVGYSMPLMGFVA